MSSNFTSNSTRSAYVGQPPNTQDDYYIVRGLLRNAGLYNVDPNLGYTRAAQKPSDDYTYTSKQPGIVAGLIIIIVAIVVATGTRLTLRASTARNMQFGSDDWATIAAAAFGVTYAACQLVMAFHGGGHHIWDATYADYNIFYYYGVVDKLIFYLCVAFNKVSLTLFIRRLADRSSRKWRVFCDVFLATLVPYILLAVFWTLFSCKPQRAQWNKLYAGSLAEAATCIDMTVQGKVLNYTHIVQGCILLLSPMAILWKVRIDTARKVRLFAIWGVGAVVVLCGLMRQLRADFTADLMWDYAELLIWTSLDVCIGVIVISLPVLDAWLTDAWRGAITKLGGVSNDRSRSGGGGGGGSATARHYAKGTAPRSHTGVSGFKTYSDSVEDIIQNDGAAYEMAIVRTDEFDVQYSSASTRRNSDVYDGEDGKIYNKHRVTGLAI